MFENIVNDMTFERTHHQGVANGERWVRRTHQNHDEDDDNVETGATDDLKGTDPTGGEEEPTDDATDASHVEGGGTDESQPTEDTTTEIRTTENRGENDNGTEPTDESMETEPTEGEAEPIDNATDAGDEEDGTHDPPSSSGTTEGTPTDFRPEQDEEQDTQEQGENNSQEQKPAPGQTNEAGAFSILIEDFSKPQFAWNIQNDTRIGGSSSASFTMQPLGAGFITFAGHINATFDGGPPGVAKLTAHPDHDGQNVATGPQFPLLASCLGFQLLARRSNAYMGYTIILVDARTPNARDEHGAGYMARLWPAEEWATIQIPFRAFTDSWDQLYNTTETFTCQEEFCPSADSLYHVDRLSIGAMYETEDFQLDVKLLGAYGCTDDSILTAYEWPQQALGVAGLVQTVLNTAWGVIACGVLVIIVGTCCLHHRRQRAYAKHSRLIRADLEDAWSPGEDDIELI